MPMDESKRLVLQDELLAQEFANVTPLPAANSAALPSRRTRPSEAQLARREAATAILQTDPNFLTLREPDMVGAREVLSFMRPGIQLGVFRNLRLGHYPPEAYLDLHRKTAEESRKTLWQFIQDSRQLGARTVMVLHGRAEFSPKPALLKSYVNAWLQELPEVLAFHSASKKDGGVGAVYILLKKSDTEKQLNRELHGSR